VKLYSWEALSEAAVKLVADLPTVPLTPLHELDILHVALARQIGCQELITGDSRQARLSEKIGLHAVRLAPAATHKRKSADQ